MDFTHLIDENFSGVISVRRRNEPIFQSAFGYADRANKTPNDIATKFGTASAGKVFVAASVLGLIEKGALQFDTPIGDILRFDWKGIDPGITVRQLLTHTSGIPDYFDESVMRDYEELWRDFPNYRIRKSADLIPLFIDKPMAYQKGTRFQYNNTGYVVLGLIMEEITHMPFDAYLEKVIFQPCGMTDTGYFELDRLPAKCAFSYIYDRDKNDYRTNIYSVDAKGSGAGGAFTTAGDVEKFWDALLGEKIIGAETLRMMLTPQVKENCYGFGVWLINGKIPSFQGCDPGANFMTSCDLEKELSITVLCNMDWDVEQLHGQLYSVLTA